MKIGLKITRRLLATIRADLARPHPFAHERVGWVAAGVSATTGTLWLLAHTYRPVDDVDYLPDDTVGAMMGPEAIRKALQWAMTDRVAVLHVHTHGGIRVPNFSRVDLREQAKYVPSFFQLAPQRPHGALVLSDTAARGHVWLDRAGPYVNIERFLDVGAPLTEWSVT